MKTFTSAAVLAITTIMSFNTMAESKVNKSIILNKSINKGNATVAIGIAEILKRKGVNISSNTIKKGIRECKNPGRCEVIEKNPYITLEGAQNQKSAMALKKTIKSIVKKL